MTTSRFDPNSPPQTEMVNMGRSADDNHKKASIVPLSTLAHHNSYCLCLESVKPFYAQNPKSMQALIVFLIVVFCVVATLLVTLLGLTPWLYMIIGVFGILWVSNCLINPGNADTRKGENYSLQTRINTLERQAKKRDKEIQQLQKQINQLQEKKDAS